MEATEMILPSKDIVLIVDDDPKNRYTLKNVLKKDDREILTADSGEEALRILLKQNVSLIIIDVNMPDLDGFDTVDILKRRKQIQDVPILFITSMYKMPEHVRRGFKVGAYDYIFRPIEGDLLRNKVDLFLTLFNQKVRLEGQAEKLSELNNQLEKTIEMLEQSNTDLEHFAYIASHDLQEPLRPFGIKQEKRKFRPHLTLGRFRRSRGGKAHLNDLLWNYNDLKSPVCSLEELSLFKSELKPGGAEYTKLDSWPLTGQN